MNKREEIVKYFDDMCDIFYTEKIMFDKWKMFFEKLKETFNSGININYVKYFDALKYCLVYCEDYGDERKYKDDIANLKTFYDYIKV